MNPLYLREHWIAPLRFADSARTLLCQLFSPAIYSKDEKNFYQYICRSATENFIYRELLAYTDIISISYPKDNLKQYSQQYEFLYRLAIVYFLNCRHNAKLERCEADKYNVKLPDDFLMERIFQVAYQCCAHDTIAEDAAWFKTYRNCYEMTSNKKIVLKTKTAQDIKQKEDLFHQVFKFVQTATFTLHLDNGQYQWRGPLFDDAQGVRIQLKIISDSILDKEQFSYEKLIQYLCTKNRNGIKDFSETVLWHTNMGLGHRNLPLSERNAADTDLMLFCLALGLDKNVYQLLLQRRNEKFNNTPLRPRKGVLTLQESDEQNQLYSFLDTEKITERLICAKNEVKKAEEIPRKMLLHASIDMMKIGLYPILKFTPEEKIKYKYEDFLCNLSNEKQEQLKQFFGENK